MSVCWRNALNSHEYNSKRFWWRDFHCIAFTSFTKQKAFNFERVYSTLQKIKAIFGEKKSKKIHSQLMHNGAVSIHSIFIVLWSFCQNSISNPFLSFWIFPFSFFLILLHSPLLDARFYHLFYIASKLFTIMRIANDENIVVE